MKVIRKLRRVASPLKQAISDLVRGRTQGDYRFTVEQFGDDGIIEGWIHTIENGNGHVPLGIYTADMLLASGAAEISRSDVRAVFGCSTFCGFRFELSSAQLMQAIEDGDGVIQIKTMGEEPVLVGETRIEVDKVEPSVPANAFSRGFQVFEAQVNSLLDMSSTVPEDITQPSVFHQPEFERHGRMFTKERVIPEVPENEHAAYLDYVRYRYRMDETYNVQTGLESSDRYLHWYITSYRSQEKHRVPLSREELEYLNAPLVMGGEQFALSRVIWWRLVSRKDMLTSTDLNNRDSFMNVLFWWAHQDAPHLYFEDCLVPDRYVSLLSGVHPSRAKDKYPLTYFTERYFQNMPQLHFLDMGSPEGRKTLGLCLLLQAVSHPHVLKFIPRKQVNDLLRENEDGSNEFETFLNEALNAGAALKGEEAPNPIRMSRVRYGEVLRQKQFDLNSMSFMTISPDGDRFEAAAMPVPNPDAPEVDIQLIGPLAKASGLGQATRLSADILRDTGVSVRGVDFDLDNPAPEGFSSDTMIEDYGPAKINMIHLNAESIPLAFAYQPDVFSGAYNIGYFFWELDKPAYCHYLGMDMLDEIWVPTEYGVSIYKEGAQGKPVINVGMCYEETPNIDRESSRTFVEDRFRLNDDNFVCLVAFDSFSFVQRKNPVSVLKAFQQAFKDVPEARLIVKTQNRDSVFDPVQMHLWDQVDAMVNSDRRIIVMNETLSYQDLLRLKAGSDCYISLHKSEGWGFGMIEAMNLGVPVVCTAYSGNMDFCTEDTAWLVDYDETVLKPEEYIFVRRGSKWAEPRIDHAAQQLRAAYDQPEERQKRAEAAKQMINQNFSKDAISKRYGARLKQILTKLSK